LYRFGSLGNLARFIGLWFRLLLLFCGCLGFLWLCLFRLVYLLYLLGSLAGSVVQWSISHWVLLLFWL
jgi:hypothetical protein